MPPVRNTALICPDLMSASSSVSRQVACNLFTKSRNAVFEAGARKHNTIDIRADNCFAVSISFGKLNFGCFHLPRKPMAIAMFDYSNQALKQIRTIGIL